MAKETASKTFIRSLSESHALRGSGTRGSSSVNQRATVSARACFVFPEPPSALWTSPRDTRTISTLYLQARSSTERRSFTTRSPLRDPLPLGSSRTRPEGEKRFKSFSIRLRYSVSSSLGTPIEPCSTKRSGPSRRAKANPLLVGSIESRRDLSVSIGIFVMSGGESLQCVIRSLPPFSLLCEMKRSLPHFCFDLFEPASK
jgi:hypothetical protein